MHQNVVYYPDWFDDVEVACEKCDKSIDLNFLEKRPPCLPCYVDGSVYQPVSFDIVCNHCQNSQQYRFEMIEYKCDIPVFGDDAFREYQDKIIVSFSLISTTPDIEIESLRNDFSQIKRKLNGNLPPDSWCLHMTDLWSGQQRKKRKHLSHVTRDQIDTLCQDIRNLLSKYGNGIEIYNASSVYYRPSKFNKSKFKQFKELTYYALLMRLFYEGTKMGSSPRLYFETADDDGWAKNLFRGGRLTMMWPIITHGVPIRSPEFVGKNFDFRMELADFISFVIARYLFTVAKRANGDNMEFDVDPSWLGKVRYLGFRENGNCILKTSDSYPLNLFFQGTSWEAP